MTDILAAVQTELSEAMVPWPEDYVEDLTPPAALFLLRQMAMATSKVVTGAVISIEVDASTEELVMTEILNGVAACIAGATHACVALGVLPKEAEDAMTGEVATTAVAAAEVPEKQGPVYS